MSGQVATADACFIHGWAADEDEEVNVDSDDSSGNGAACLRRLACITSVGGTSEAREEECDSACVNTAAPLEQVKPLKCEDTGPSEEKAATNNQEMSADETSPSDKQTPQQGKRLDARRFRNHFAAKLSGSKRLREEADKVRNSSPRSSERSTSEQEGALTLHVSLHVELEKPTDEASNADSGFVDENENVNIEKNARKIGSIKKEDDSADIVCMFNQSGEGTTDGQSKRAKKESTKSDSASCTKSDGEITKSNLRANSFKGDLGKNNTFVHLNEVATTGNDSGHIDNHNSVCHRCKHEGKLISCCDGKNCKITYHIGCLDPPLKEVPPNDWYCPDCTYKRLVYGMTCVSKGIESIWDVKDGTDTDKDGCKATEKHYFTKHKGVSHAHNIWLPESQVLKESPKLLYAFKKKLNQGKPPHWDPEWTKPSRIIGKRTTMLSKRMDTSSEEDSVSESSSCIEWLVKWENLGYEFCTWEVAEKVPCEVSVMEELIKSYEARSRKIIEQDHHKKVKKAENFSVAHFNDLKLKHNWMKGENPQHDCSQVIYKVCEFWQKGIPGIVLNEVKKERMIIAAGFLICSVEEFLFSSPTLIIAPPALLEQWSGAIQKWMPKSNVVTYGGTKEAREVIKKYEFHNEDKDCIADIIITSLETLNLDMEFWKDFNLGALIVDETQRMKGIKTSKSLQQLSPDYRLLLFSEPIKDTVDEHVHVLSLLSENIGPIREKDQLSQDRNGALVELKARISKHIIYDSKQENNTSVYPQEFWVPVKMTPFQLQQYCKLFIDKSETLARGKRSDLASGPNELVLKVRECCSHPFLVNSCFQETPQNLSAKQLLDFGIRASGKLKLLDMMLSEAKTSNKRVVIVTQTHLRTGKSSQMEILDDYMRQQFGVDSYERLDGGIHVSRKAAVVQRFNAKDSQSFVLLLDRRACAPSIKLRSVDCIIIFDSDWNPYADIQALLKIYSHGDFENISICRLYCPHTVEERALIAARRGAELDANHHNFSVATCQRLLRWGVQKNFEILDKQNGSKNVPEEMPYSSEIIKMLLDKCHNEGNNVSDYCLDTAFCLREAGKYKRGIPLFGERDEDLSEEDKFPATDFWTELLKDRQVEVQEAQVRELRARKKVQYYEDYYVPPITQDESNSEDSRRKRRKIPETIETAGISKATKGVSADALCGDAIRDADNTMTVKLPTDVREVEQDNVAKATTVKPAHVRQVEQDNPDNTMTVKLPTDVRGVEQDNVAKATTVKPADVNGVEQDNVAKPTTVKPTDKFEKVPGLTDKPNSDPAEAGNTSELNAEKVTTHTVLDSTATDALSVKTEQQQLLQEMRQDLDKLCKTLQFQPDTRSHVDQLLYSVGSSFKLPKDKSLLHAIELSLCWLAAEQQHYCIDRQATLSLAETCFGVQLDKIETVYSKLEDRWKKRFQQGQQIPATRGRENEICQRIVGDLSTATADQEALLQREKGALTIETERHVPKELSVNQDNVSFGPHDSQARPHPSVNLSKVPPEHEQILQKKIIEKDNERRQALILSQKNQIMKFEMIEKSLKQRLQKQNDMACFKMKSSSVPPSEIQKLTEAFKSVYMGLDECLKALRSNLIKKQHQERDKGNITSFGNEDIRSYLEPELTEKQILDCLSPALRKAIENGDFGLPSLAANPERPNIVCPNQKPLPNGGGNNVSRLTSGQPATNGETSDLQARGLLVQQRQQSQTLATITTGVQEQQSSPASISGSNSQTVLPSSVPMSLSNSQTILPSSVPTFVNPVPISNQRTSLPSPSPSLQHQTVSHSLLQQNHGQPDRANEPGRPAVVNLHQSSISSANVSRNGSVGRVAQNGPQARHAQPYQSDPLAQEYLRLRKEQDKLKSCHEAEKERIKAEFMKELEALSKRYECKLQEEDTLFNSKASAIALNLKKVEMNRRLAEVFRHKMGSDNPTTSSPAIHGHDPRVHGSVGQSQSFQQAPSVVARHPAVPQQGMATGQGYGADPTRFHPQASSSSMERALERAIRSSMSGMPAHAMAASLPGVSPNVQSVLAAAPQRPVISAAAQLRPVISTAPQLSPQLARVQNACAPSNLAHGNVIMTSEVASGTQSNTTDRASHGSMPIETTTRVSSHNDILHTDQTRSNVSGSQNIVGIGNQNLMVPTPMVLPNVINGLGPTQPRTLPEDIGSSAAFDVICLSDDD